MPEGAILTESVAVIAEHDEDDFHPFPHPFHAFGQRADQRVAIFDRASVEILDRLNLSFGGLDIDHGGHELRFQTIVDATLPPLVVVQQTECAPVGEAPMLRIRRVVLVVGVVEVE
jgi:hypothetical protein